MSEKVLTTDPITPGVRNPTHRCKVCGALWIWFPHWPEQNPGSWSLFSQKCGPCCDNAPMGEQIEPLSLFVKRMKSLLMDIRGDYTGVTKDRILDLLPGDP